jgi:CPA2 family monovalent cation:H+ antiporter-2
LTTTALTDHAVLIGYGRVGSVIAERLLREGVPLYVIEDQDEIADRARAAGIEVQRGNAADVALLHAANIVGARWLFVAIPDGFEAGQIVAQAKAANPSLEVVARAHSDAEGAHLRHFGADTVIMGEREIALGMLAAAFPHATDEALPVAAAEPS